ncbi:MAG: hypothetical protein HWD85_00575 [Flavobacteriaceae bacterium]|nr:hypothetical protein [Flavobacteriaceae bacterium]
MKKAFIILVAFVFLVTSCDNGDECTDNPLGTPTVIFTNTKNFTIALTYNNYGKELLPGEEYRVTFLSAGQTLTYTARASSGNWSDSFKLESCTTYDVRFK